MANYFTLKGFIAQLQFERAHEEARKEAVLRKAIDRGPTLPGVSQANWELWVRERRFICPDTVDQRSCRAKKCLFGFHCRDMAARGLLGTGRPYPKDERPRCEAMTRQKTPCQMAVVPGKYRCRLHGGLSTGPKTAEGRARIAEVQRKKWEAWRLTKKPV